MYNKRMLFEWDPNKNKLNIVKHKVSFEEAQTVFYDPFAKVAEYPYHSLEEHRFIIIGYSTLQRQLIVIHCFHQEEIIRIISTRKLTKTKRKQYEELS